MKKKDLIVTWILAVVITIMYIGTLPLGLFIKWEPFGLEEWMVPSFLNTALCILIILVVLKAFQVPLDLKITGKGLALGLKQNALVFGVYLVLSLISCIINYAPFTACPTIIRVILQCGLLYIPVAILEEILLRGLVLNLLSEIFRKSEHRVLFAVGVSAALFAAGHIPSVIGMGSVASLSRFVTTLGVGMYFGYLYEKTNTLLVPIIYHYVLDMLCEIPQVFSGADWTEYNSAYLMISLMIGAAVSIYSAIGANELDKEVSNTEQTTFVD